MNYILIAFFSFTDLLLISIIASFLTDKLILIIVLTTLFMGILYLISLFYFVRYPLLQFTDTEIIYHRDRQHIKIPYFKLNPTVKVELQNQGIRIETNGDGFNHLLFLNGVDGDIDEILNFIRNKMGL